MMIVWRLLKLGTHDAFINMAIDEAVLRARIENLVPNTLRFYRWKPSSVSIGRFQNIEDEVQLDNCRKHGVDVVRRITGGGTVYHDAEHEITYSAVAGKKDLGTADVAAIYAKLCSGLAETVRILGLNADFGKGGVKNCPNLTVNDRKISGSAQSHKKGTFLQHGTLLIHVDLKKMFTFLRVPWAKTCIEVVDIAKRKITSIQAELGRRISIEELNNTLIDGFQRALNIRLVEGELTLHERKLVKKLYKEKYATRNWNFYEKSTCEK